MKEFKLWNNIVGWVVFLIATATYILTSEPTVSLWDCGEYISTAYKLQVGHPPGAPFFQLVGNFFSLFASDVTMVARMVNTMSALSSSFTILFLFWSITHLARKFFTKDQILETGNVIAIIFAGAVGALAYTFSDSFWFSAVEGEVYAMSSFFTAIVFWAMLKWEDASDADYGWRWILLIAYLVGLSIGVHLLNLLAIPAITFIYYFKTKEKVSVKGIIVTGIIGILLLSVVMYIMIPWIVILAGSLERIFVNGFGMPFNTGTIIYFLLLVGLISFGLYITHKRKKQIANLIILAFTFIVIGYSSFFILVVRSNANTPIDENNPEDALSLLAYLNREQYGDWPLLKGAYYNAPVTSYANGKPTYTKSFTVVDENYNPSGDIKINTPGIIKLCQTKVEAEKFLADNLAQHPTYKLTEAYIITDEKIGREPVYDERFVGFFPRMWSNQREGHAAVYQEYIKDESNKVTITNQDGSTETRVIPSFADNLSFFFKHQIGHMYLRYFMWNFSGKQNDVQGHGDRLNGNWISGITFLDEARLGPQGDLPVEYQHNKGNNKYFMLPLILGLLGMVFQFKKNYKDGIVVGLLFLMTGLAIVVYLNQYPYQPRERDYAYAASFYAFAIWIGLGVIALYDLLSKRMSKVIASVAVGSVTMLAVPAVMANQNWDDHDRSDRYNTLNVAINYLESCAPNAILFTNGDNDTFPLWYAQEVEGIRTDIKIVNLSLFNTDWYVDQMARKTYKADPIPLTIGRDKYIQGTNDVAYFIETGVAQKGVFYDLRKLLTFYYSTDPNTKYQTQQGGISYIPTKNVKISVDKNKVLRLGVVPERDSALIVPEVTWTIQDNAVQKNNLMMMEMLASFNWERPIYYAITTGADAYLYLTDYFQLEGMAYRLVPIKAGATNMGSYGRVNTDILYNNLMNKFKFDGIDNEKLYYDENQLRSIKNYRSNFARLASSLIDENKLDSARKVLDRGMKVLPEKVVSYDYFMIPIAEGYIRLGDSIQGKKILNRMIDIFSHDLNYYYTGSKSQPGEFINEKNNCLFIMQSVSRTAAQYNMNDVGDKAQGFFQRYYPMYEQEQKMRQ